MENGLEFLDHFVQFGRGIRQLNGLGAKLFYPIFQPMGHWLERCQRTGRVSQAKHSVRYSTYCSLLYPDPGFTPGCITTSFASI